MFSWISRTAEQPYYCHAITIPCNVFCRPASLVQRFGVAILFEMSSQAMSEVFWHILRGFIPLYEYHSGSLRVDSTKGLLCTTTVLCHVELGYPTLSALLMARMFSWGCLQARSLFRNHAIQGMRGYPASYT